MYGNNTMMHIGDKAWVVFMYTSAGLGGAVAMFHGMITVGAESCVIFAYNNALIGGAIALSSAILIVDNEANLIFSHNSAYFIGGALNLDNSTVHVNTNGI